jgi:VWFA-related protein
MRSVRTVIFLLSAAAAALCAQDVVFRSDVALVRVDTQVLDRDNRALTGLRIEDFELREEGKVLPIRNFASEEMPVDVLLLLDVSASMRPHVQRLADAAHQALRVLGKDDRVGVMVFDRSTRVRLPFKQNRDEVVREFERLLKQERFNGGTDITRGLLDAADYVQRNSRREARRAIVILTDDRTEMDRSEAAVERALARADAVLSAIIAPDAMANGRQGGQYPGGGYPRGGGGSPGGVILGRRYPGGGYPGGGYPGAGGRYPGAGQRTNRTHSAGTSEIARASGGDSMSIHDAGAFDDTLSRLRQRYALHFYLPPGVRAGEQRHLEVSLAAAARRRYPDAEVRYRRNYLAPTSTAPAGPNDPVVVSQGTTSAPGGAASSAASDPDGPPRIRRRPAVDAVRVDDPGPAPSAQTQAQAPPAQQAPADPASKAPNRGGWRRLQPGEEP